MVPMLTPNDPQYPNQWHDLAARRGSLRYQRTGGLESHDRLAEYRGGRDIDTGITNHVDLSGRTVPGYDFIDDTLERQMTGVAATTIPATRAIGCWRMSVMPARLREQFLARHPRCGHDRRGQQQWRRRGGSELELEDPAGARVGRCGGYTSDIADGRAAGRPACRYPACPPMPTPPKWLNLSLGRLRGVRCQPIRMPSMPIIAAGTTIVVSAGNSNANAANYRPGNCTGVITVAATATGMAAVLYTATTGPSSRSAPRAVNTAVPQFLTACSPR